ncbi:hypothetical protein GCM10023172_02590 [Hymenobacter ginsengisoli]|uniref:Type I restriction enzyme R protein N-terminal domain-containing protein n=2 Tax=Hymenobacter ginsengisoli TaxID=1051626 RepID=A0ABP8PYX4_9BACT|nr:hypothetical protein [Hymenobacter sp. KCTC 23674]
MPLPSPLATLINTLADVCQQARQHQSLLSKNEAATRSALIDPVLRALGWDTADVRMVEPEHTVQNKQSLDYVLRSRSGTIQAVIEAKRLGEPLDRLGHVGALIGYAFSLKPTAFFITDGLHWHCYSPAHSHYEPTVSLHLTEDALLPAALQLLQLLDAAHGGYGLPQVLTIQSTPLTSPVPVAKSGKVRHEKPSTERAVLVGKSFTELAFLNTLALMPGQKPTSLRLPDGSVRLIKTWKDILLEVCRFLLLHHKHLTLPLPDKAGKKTYLFSFNKPLKGSSVSASYQGKPIFIYTNYSAKDHLANAIYIEALLPADVRRQKVAVAF